MKYDGTSWVNVGNAGFSQGVANYTSLAIDNGTPYVAYMDNANSKATVMKYDGTSWVNVGNAGFSQGGADSTSLVIDNSTPYVAYIDTANSYKATVMEYALLRIPNKVTNLSARAVTNTKINLSWTPPGDGGSQITGYKIERESPIGGGFSTIVENTGTNDYNYSDINLSPRTEYNYKVSAINIIGNGPASETATALTITSVPGSWINVGSAGFSQATVQYTSLAFDNGTPYVAYRDDANSNKATVMKFDGTSWVNVGNAGFSQGEASYISLAFDNGTPYVSYRDGANSNKATVMKYDGTSWVSVGTAGFSQGQAYYTSLAINNSTSYVAYQDITNSFKVTVMKYDGTSWVNVGNAGFSQGQAYYTSLAINNGTPYVAYQDITNSSKATVMKYDGTSWVNVGTAGFSQGQADYISLSITLDGTPYVVYKDDANSNKATVMKYDGTSWVNVGTAGFSQGQAYYTSLAINNGTPYVAYQDGANSTKATVMKYNGTSWVVVGTVGFSQGQADYISLAFDNDTPYVAYLDTANSGKTTVMKFIPAILPGKIENFNAISSGTKVDLTWTLPEDGGSPLTGYKIERESPVGGGFITIAENESTNDYNYTDIGLDEETEYNYRIYAINDVGEGPVSDPASVTTGNQRAPQITEISFTGNLYPGFTLVGSYTYTDSDGDLEGNSILKWYRNDVAIDGAISENYILTQDDLDKTIIFEVTPVALSGILTGNPVRTEGILIGSSPYSKKYDFGIGTEGSPQGSLTLLNNKLYGLTSSNDYYGTLFEFDPATDTYTKKYEFDSSNGINSPHNGSLIESGGKLYGLTSSNDYDMIFEFDPVNNIFTKKYDFVDTNSMGTLVANNGKLYGLTSSNDYSTNDYPYDTIYEFDPLTDIYTQKHSFDGINGGNPQGSLISNGQKLYGLTSSNDYGVIFEFDLGTDTYTKKYDFDSSNAIKSPYHGSLVDNNGKLYGLTSSNDYQNLESTNDYDMIFEFDPVSDIFTKKYDFEVRYSKGSLSQKDNKLYGFTSTNDYDLISTNDYDLASTNDYYGTIFEYDTLTNTYTKKFSLDRLSGADPVGRLTLYNGKFYGITSRGGENDKGVIFEFDPNVVVIDTEPQERRKSSGSMLNKIILDNTLNIYPVSELNSQTNNLNITRILKLKTPRMNGSDVLELQTYLNLNGYDCGLADGVFGNKTKQAVINFQKANGLLGDGIVGLQTIMKINTTVSTGINKIETPLISRKLKQGMEGNDVKYLQTYLNSRGYDCGLADGFFGNKTKQAVILLQLASGLVGDGVVGPMTIDKMK